MAHTKGPWRIASSNDDYTQYWIEADKWGRIMRVEDVSNEGLGNARLIATAPKLLYMLEEAVKHIQSFDCTLDGLSDTDMRWIKKYKAVINEARGVGQ